MHPTLKLLGFAIAPLILSLPSVVLISDQGGSAIAQTTSDRKAEADYLLEQGLQQLKARHPQVAIQSWQQSLKIYREIKDQRGEGWSLGGLGLAYRELGNYEKAINYLQKQLELVRQSKDRRNEGAVIGNLGLVYYSLRKYSKAVEMHQQSLQISREVKNPVGEGAALANLAAALNGDKKYDQAVQAALQSLEILQKSSLNPQDEYQILETLGFAYTRISNLPQAALVYEKAVSIVRRLGFQEDEMRLLSELSNAYFYDSEFNKSINALKRLLILSESKKDYKKKAYALAGIGDGYNGLGQYSEAIDYNSQSLEVSRTNQDNKAIRRALNGLGNVYESLGSYKKAIYFYSSVLDSLKSTGDSDDSSVHSRNIALTGLGNSYQGLNEYEKAVFFYKQRLEIAQRSGDLRGQVPALISSGLANFRMGKYEEAISLSLRAFEISTDLKDRTAQGTVLSNLGLFARAVNRIEDSIDFYKRSLLVSQERENYKSKAIALQNLGFLLFEKHETQLAEDNLKNSILIWESFRSALPDGQRRSLFELSAQAYRYLQQVQVALHKNESALETSDRGRARAFIELLAARFAGETLQNAVAKQKVEKLSIAQIQQVAKTQTATLVQYSIVSDKNLYIYIIQPDGRISFRKTDLTTLGKSLTDFVNASRDRLGVRGRTEEARILITLTPEKQQELQEKRDRSLRQLHQLLIEPIADLLPKDSNDRVIFMPQGELFLVPFPALLNAQNQPLISQHTILTAPSIQTLDLTHKTAQSRPKANRPALVVGNPTMPTISTVIGDPPTRLAALPGSETEAIAIAKQLNTQALTGANAKKAAIVQQMQKAGIIHLATHGLLDSFKGDTPGAIALAPNGNGDRNDGLLTSGELFDLKLNADLVVLSACDTGRGDITGDGVVGLSRSLFVAGVPSVIVSLWKVPDESTAFLMTEFYKNWKDRKLDKAQALRQAMLTTRDKYHQPLDWAAFTLIGEAN